MGASTRRCGGAAGGPASGTQGYPTVRKLGNYVFILHKRVFNLLGGVNQGPWLPLLQASG